MDELARELPEYNVINEISGCGKKLTSRVIAEIGDVRRFKNAGSIIAYAGVRCTTILIRTIWKRQTDIFLNEVINI